MEAEKQLADITEVLANKRSLLCVLHNYPDPDAIASAMALSYLAKELNQMTTTIAYGGLIGRAENIAMVKELKIHMKHLSRLKISKYDCIAMLDTQPGSGNNSFPENKFCDLVIDHHPLRRSSKVSLAIIDNEIGALSTLFVELLIASGLPLPTNLATALAYAIRTETQDLGRETNNRDIAAYLKVYVQSNVRKLAKIANPKLPRTYYKALSKTLNSTYSYRQLICAHLGDVEVPEIVAEMADLLLRHQRISWSLCTGRFKNDLYISLRSSNPRAKAGKLIQKIVKDRKNSGGHGMFAGGKISLDSMSDEEIKNLEHNLSDRFARLFGYRTAVWHPIISENN